MFRPRDYSLGAAVVLAAMGLAGVVGAAETEDPSVAELRAEAIRKAVVRVRGAIVQLQPIGGGDSLVAGGAVSPTTGLFLPAELSGGQNLILTSSYGLDPAPASIVVTYDDGSRSSGRVLAIDFNRCLALVEASRSPGTSPDAWELAPSPRVGETAVAVGRTFRADEPNLSVGIVSALGRIYGRAIQTDAAASPANYGGPLIDLRGRVIGLVTPLAASGGGTQEGVGWYDSGIGFAATLTDLAARLPRLRSGNDIRRGLAGIAFASGNPFSGSPELLTVHPGGPAEKAGLKAGDILTLANGQPIDCPNAYRLAVDRLDDGQVVLIEAKRGSESIKAKLVLAAELLPYRHPYLGLIAERSAKADDQEGLVLEEVIAEGPAHLAGVLPGDRLLQLKGQPVSDRASVLKHLGACSPGDRVELVLARGDQQVALELGVAPLAFGSQTSSVAATEWEKAELIPPGSKRKCELASPKENLQRTPLIVWLSQNQQGREELFERFASRGCLVAAVNVAPKASSFEAEQAHVSDLLDLLIARPDVDPARVAIGASGREAPLALAIALKMKDRFAGVVLDRWAGRAPRVPANTPSERLGILLVRSESRRKAIKKTLVDKGYSVGFLSEAEAADDRSTPAWMLGLDRF